MDAFDKFKQNQREGWAHFAPLELLTTAPAAQHPAALLDDESDQGVKVKRT